MGNIRPSFIKIRAIALCKEYPDKFTDDFDTNKKLVEEYTDLVGEDGKPIKVLFIPPELKDCLPDITAFLNASAIS